MDDFNFAEIEIDTTQNRSAAGDAALRFFTSVAPPQPIQPRILEPIREKFYEMRKLASIRPFARNDSELFYRQARFMEDFEDNFDGDAKFNMYYPFYQNMGYDYLRTYFTWRTKVRLGDIQPTSLSYVYLYIYELLSGIGVSNPTQGLEKLLDLWNCTFIRAGVEKYLPKWFKDYFVFYGLNSRGTVLLSECDEISTLSDENSTNVTGTVLVTTCFSDFVEKHKMQKYFSLSLLFDETIENKLELWNNVSGYNIRTSRFYKDGNEQMLCDCFVAVLNSIKDFCEKRNTRFEDLLVYSVSNRSPWQPFKHALFGSRVKQTDREIKISDFERYYCKNGQWTANLPIYYSSQKDFVGYIIKKTEACLRQETGYKYKLVAEMKSGNKPFRELQRPAAKRAELDKAIEKAVSDFYRNLNMVAVKVDHTNLARIREEALETQEQLIVTEGKQGDGSSAWFFESREDKATMLENQAEEPSPCLPSDPITLSFADGWKALRKSLTDIERQALSLVLQDGADIKAFANANNIMLEVLADSINEKAADSIGDNLLEVDDVLILYDEYRENVENLMGDDSKAILQGKACPESVK